jgi:hypothetical protein
MLLTRGSTAGSQRKPLIRLFVEAVGLASVGRRIVPLPDEWSYPGAVSSFERFYERFSVHRAELARSVPRLKGSTGPQICRPVFAVCC